MISFYDKPFLSLPVENLWLPFNTVFNESASITCLCFDSWAYAQVVSFMDTCTIDREDMLQYVAENEEKVVGLSIYVTMSRGLEIKMLKQEMAELAGALEKANVEIAVLRRRLNQHSDRSRSRSRRNRSRSRRSTSEDS